MSKSKALLLDLDGTLLDSAPDLAYAVDAMLNQRGFAPAGEANTRLWVGGGAYMLVKRALAHAVNQSEDSLAEADINAALSDFKVVYREHCCHSSQVYPHVVDVLTRFHQQGIPIAIVTNKPYDFAKIITAHYGFDRYCTVLVGGDTLPTKKPDPAMLQHAATLLGVDIANCIMVGDSSADIKAGIALGIPALAVSYGYNKGMDLKALGATAVLDDFLAVERTVTEAKA